MSPARLLPLLILLLPIAEIAGFVIVGRALGLFATLGLVILSGVAGIALMRISGLRALAAFQADLSRGRVGAAPPPVASLAYLAAGMLLLIPGFVTDILALLLLLPPVRALLAAAITRRMVVVRPGGQARSGVVDLDEADYRRTNDPADPSPWTPGNSNGDLPRIEDR